MARRSGQYVPAETPTGSARKKRRNPQTQLGQELLLESGVALKPRRVARRRMRQWNISWRVLGPCFRRFSQRLLASASQKMTLCVLPDEQSQFDQRQLHEQLIEPQLRAFTTRRQIAAAAPAGIAIAHRNDRDARCIVKDLVAHAHPRAQTLPARIVPGNAGLVHAKAGRLSNDEDSGCRCRLQHRARTERQRRCARAASTHCCQQCIEREICWLSQLSTKRRNGH